jgi:hypothetical protein
VKNEVPQLKLVFKIFSMFAYANLEPGTFQREIHNYWQKKAYRMYWPFYIRVKFIILPDPER